MIYIIRHGKTERNQANVLQGRSDYPLNDEGIRQAEAAADRLRNIRFDHVFSSPLTRAVQTAKIVVPDLEPVIDERLIEMDYGPYEGTDLNRLPPEILFFFRDFVHNPAPESGRNGTAVLGDRAGRLVPGPDSPAAGEYPDLHTRDRDERTA